MISGDKYDTFQIQQLTENAARYYGKKWHIQCGLFLKTNSGSYQLNEGHHFTQMNTYLPLILLHWLWLFPLLESDSLEYLLIHATYKT
jgi:hypothetical protein